MVFQAAAIGVALAADAPLVVPVWPGRAPDESASVGDEKIRLVQGSSTTARWR